MTDTSAFLDPVVKAFVSASEFSSWFWPGKYKFPFQTRIKVELIPEVKGLPQDASCGLGRRAL